MHQTKNELTSLSFLLKPWFWFLFIIAVIVSLYLYGLNILGDRTELAQSKKALKQVNDELLKCKLDNANKSSMISELKSKLISLSNTITQENHLIVKLNDSLYTLLNRPPKIKYKHNTVYKNNTIYKDKPEPYHPYGKGYGKLTLFKNCNCYNLKFWIDGEFAGTTSIIFSLNYPVCGENGTVSKIVLAVKHYIQGKDQENHSWNFYITSKEDECLVHGVNSNS